MGLTPVEKADITEQDEVDRALLRRIARGDRDAFDALYFDYHRRLSKFLLRFSTQYPNVEEIINDTMFSVWKQASEFEGRSKVSTWIMGIAFRQASNMLRGLDRARRRDREAAEQKLHWDEAPSDAERIASSDWIGRALEQLPVEQRAAMELAYVFGHSTIEIAEICDCPVNTVKSRMFAARRALRSLLPALAGERSVGPDQRS